MHVLVVGGTGFVGLNIAEAFYRDGHRVTLFDRAPPPPGFAAAHDCVVGDVRDRAIVGQALARDVDVVVLGAAITAGPEREARDPDAILAVNLASLPPILEHCRKHRIRRVINLSSSAVYGAASATHDTLVESACAAPESLYAITKYASERVGRRLAGLWSLDFINLRLSAVFGRWERDTGVRDTQSPQAQMLAAAAAGREAVLPRAGERDWIYAADVGEAVLTVAKARRQCRDLYNVSTGRRWSALDWGRSFARHVPGFVCRLAERGETSTVDLHAASDRPSLSNARLRDELGWSARFDMEASVRDLVDWWGAQQGAAPS